MKTNLAGEPIDPLKGIGGLPRHMSHTQGPWIYDNSEDNYVGNVIRHNGVLIARMLHCSTSTCMEHNANAHLIAAAPDLLSACKIAYLSLKEIISTRSIEAVEAGFKACEIIAESVAKAEGR